MFTLDFSPQIKDFMGSEATNNLTTTGLTVDQNILVSHYGKRCNNYFNNQGEYIGLGKRHLGGIHTININTSQHPNHKAYKQKIINTETGKTYDGEFDEFLSYDKTSKIATVKNNNMEIKIRINHIIGQQIGLAL